jgi:hypothetical protein
LDRFEGAAWISLVTRVSLRRSSACFRTRRG